MVFLQKKSMYTYIYMYPYIYLYACVFIKKYKYINEKFYSYLGS